ncbi:MAG TPA: polymer-forming cytoskeletal protein [Alphaproteobacteria bacterium]|nr:polymer-forming cytoskeletal protein [Alphaproteobacteria bacterium]
MFSKSAKSAKSSTTTDNIKMLPKPAVPSVISADMKIIGAVESRGDLQVDGTIEGDVTSRAVTISDSASVRGSVSAESVRVSGIVKGGVNAKSVILTATAKVEGDIVHQSLSIETGAAFEGQCKRMAASERPETVKAQLLVGSAAE